MWLESWFMTHKALLLMWFGICLPVIRVHLFFIDLPQDPNNQVSHPVIIFEFFKMLPEPSNKWIKVVLFLSDMFLYSDDRNLCFEKSPTSFLTPRAYCPPHLFSNLSLSLAIVAIVFCCVLYSCLFPHRTRPVSYRLAAEA